MRYSDFRYLCIYRMSNSVLLNLPQYLEQGDLLCTKLINRNDAGLLCVVICMDGGKRREIHDCNIRVFCPHSHVVPMSGSHGRDYDGYQIGDLLRLVVISFNPAQSKIIVSMKIEYLPQKCANKFHLGLLSDQELPVHYR